jgi:hypothetical protein
VTFCADTKGPFVDINPGFEKEVRFLVLAEVLLEQDNSTYVDSMLNVVFPAGTPDIGMPKIEEYDGSKFVCGTCFQPFESSATSESVEKYGILRLPQRSVGPVFTAAGASKQAVNIPAKPGYQESKAGQPA